MTADAAASRVSDLRGVQPGWDGYSAPPPNDTAENLAMAVLRAGAACGLSATHVGLVADGGIGVLFKQNDRHADIECTNDGEIVVLLAERLGEPTVQSIPATPEGIASLMNGVQAYLT